MIKLSIIIPTYNEEENIEKCIESILKQTYRNFEIIIVDDGSTDKTRKIILDKKESRIRLINGEHKGPGFSRNIGAKLSKGNILVFIDADMTFDKNYLKNLTAPLFKNKKLIGTTHDYEVASNLKNIWSRCWGKERVSSKDFGKVIIFRAIRKDKFIELGGFDPKYGYADDQTFWLKHHIKPKMAKNTICFHVNPESLREVYLQSRWIGSSLNYPLLKNKITVIIFLLLMILVMPFGILILSIKKSYQNKDYSILFPWMVIFMFYRYIGTLSGIKRKVFNNKNFK